VYAIAVTAVVYRKLSWQNFVDACTGAVRTTGLIVFMIGAAASFGWLLAYLQVPTAAVEVLTSISHGDRHWWWPMCPRCRFGCRGC
jgi:TRAP-type C4-dicarboxylate transport system permease large subunit